MEKCKITKEYCKNREKKLNKINLSKIKTFKKEKVSYKN